MDFKPFCLILLGILLLSCDSDDYPYSEVPSVVLNEFRAEYSEARETNFRQTGEDYEVEFELDGKEHKALIDPSGNILKEKKEISWSELPAEVRQALKAEFEEENIEDPEMVTSGGKIYYQAEINRFFNDEKVALDQTGKRNSKFNYWK